MGMVKDQQGGAVSRSESKTKLCGQRSVGGHGPL